MSNPNEKGPPRPKLPDPTERDSFRGLRYLPPPLRQVDPVLETFYMFSNVADTSSRPAPYLNVEQQAQMAVREVHSQELRESRRNQRKMLDERAREAMEAAVSSRNSGPFTNANPHVELTSLLAPAPNRNTEQTSNSVPNIGNTFRLAASSNRNSEQASNSIPKSVNTSYELVGYHQCENDSCSDRGRPVYKAPHASWVNHSYDNVVQDPPVNTANTQPARNVQERSASGGPSAQTSAPLPPLTGWYNSKPRRPAFLDIHRLQGQPRSSPNPLAFASASQAQRDFTFRSSMPLPQNGPGASAYVPPPPFRERDPGVLPPLSAVLPQECLDAPRKFAEARRQSLASLSIEALTTPTQAPVQMNASQPSGDFIATPGDADVPGESALLVEFDLIKAHTAKCDVCDKRNIGGMSRCRACGWQSCHVCTVENECMRTHLANRRIHTGPIEPSELFEAETKTGKKRIRTQSKEDDAVAESSSPPAKRARVARQTTGQLRPARQTMARTLKRTRASIVSSNPAYSSSSSTEGQSSDDNLDCAIVGARNLFAMSLEANATSSSENEKNADKKGPSSDTDWVDEEDCGSDGDTELLTEDDDGAGASRDVHAWALGEADKAAANHLEGGSKKPRYPPIPLSLSFDSEDDALADMIDTSPFTQQNGSGAKPDATPTPQPKNTKAKAKATATPLEKRPKAKAKATPTPQQKNAKPQAKPAQRKGSGKKTTC